MGEICIMEKKGASIKKEEGRSQTRSLIGEAAIAVQSFLGAPLLLSHVRPHVLTDVREEPLQRKYIKVNPLTQALAMLPTLKDKAYIPRECIIIYTYIYISAQGYRELIMRFDADVSGRAMFPATDGEKFYCKDEFRANFLSIQFQYRKSTV